MADLLSSIFAKKQNALADDAIEYRIYFDDLLSPQEDAQGVLSSHLTDIRSFCAQWTADFIWQKDPFELAVAESGDPPHLLGRTAFGDNIEDEWFIVFLLFQISHHFRQVSISAVDSDGDFLLIEAAEYLPDWLEPESSAHRVWIRHGELHIIPLPSTPAELALIPAVLSRDSALFVLSSDICETIAETQIQQAVTARIAQFPAEALAASTQFVRCFLPDSVAAILSAASWLIAPAVEAFYLRDSLDIAKAIKMRRFSPKDPSNGNSTMVCARVRLTRCLYAQLKQQRFSPPKPFLPLPEWFTTDVAKRSAAEFGIKIAFGFEILFQNSTAALKKGDDPRAHAVVEAINTTPSLSEFKWSSFEDMLGDSDDSWLYVSPESVEEMLQAKQLKEEDAKEISEAMAQDIAAEFGLDGAANTFQSFLQQTSEFDGVDVSGAPFDVDKLLRVLGGGLRQQEEADEEEDEEQYEEDEEMQALMAAAGDELDQKGVRKQLNEEGLRAHAMEQFLLSYKAQSGAAGPVGNLFGSLGIELPDDADACEADDIVE